MPGCCLTPSYPSFIRRLAGGRREPSWLNGYRRHSPIHILNDDVLLNIFELYRLPDDPDEDHEVGTVAVLHRHCWWYKLAHVCRQWRNIILESPSRLDLHLYCTNGVPVADMLAHSPPLPLAIGYLSSGGRIAEEESGLFLALSHRDRIRHIDFRIYPDVTKFVTVMDDQFPVLERMYIHSRTEVVLPETFQAPNLRHLRLSTASLTIGSPLLTTTAAGLVTLELLNIPFSAYFPPSYILNRLSLMAQLEKLSIEFQIPFRIRDDERQPHQTLDMITLPNLRWFAFDGASTYLEGLVARISAPSLNKLHVRLFHQPSFIIPRLLQFVQSSKNLRFTAVQVASAVEFFRTLSPLLSVVEHLTLGYQEHRQSSSEWHNTVDRSQWCELLRPFSNAKTIYVQDDLVSKTFGSLLSGDGEPPLEVLPNLEEIRYSGGSDIRDSFTRFVNERQVAGRPVSLRLVDRWMFWMPLGL